jgi:hypothetical protein
VLVANKLLARAAAPRERGVIYVAVGSTSLQKAFKSARSVRFTNAARDIGSLLVTDSNGKAQTTRWASTVFDDIIDVGQKSAQLRFDEMHEFEGFKKKACEVDVGACANAETSHESDNRRDERLSKSSMILKRLRILKVRTFMLGLQLYRTILFLDTDTVVCAPLGRLFEALDAPRTATLDTKPSHVAFVPVPKSHTHGHEVVSKVFDVPADFPEANTGVLVVRNASATKRLLANWNIAYHVLARHSSRLMDQPAFRVSLFRSAVGYRELPSSANCRGRNRHTKLAIPLACDGFRETSDRQASRYGAGRDCVILHSHELSIQNAKGPNGLPNFYGDRAVSAIDTDFKHRYGLPDELTTDNDAHTRGLRSLLVRAGALVDMSINGSLYLHTSATAKPADLTYWRAPTVFLHIPKAAGNSVKELFVKGFLKDQRGNQQKGSVKTQSLHIDTRRDWDLDTKSKKMHAVLYGAFAFGACDSHSQAPCAYYVVLREPAARIVSEHKYCHSVNFEDQCCTGRRGAAYMRTLDVTQWAEEKGSFMLEHFLRLAPEDWHHSNAETYVPWRQRNRETRVNPLETRRGREGVANAADLQFVVEHLEEWFAVIGITERFEESMSLFAFALTGKLIPRSLAGSVHTHNQNTTTSVIDLASLNRVNEAVKLDVGLYRAALALFDKQLAAFKQRDFHI